jgi:anaerobic C4-dicarboxylate transporter
MRRKIAVSVVAVAAFVLIILWIGASFGGNALSATGGLALVGSIVLFILVMAGVGVWLSG